MYNEFPNSLLPDLLVSVTTVMIVYFRHMKFCISGQQYTTNYVYKDKCSVYAVLTEVAEQLTAADSVLQV